MLKEEHKLYDKIYKIKVVVGTVKKEDIEEYDFLGLSIDEHKNKVIIVGEWQVWEQCDSYNVFENDYMIFDTKEQAEKFIGWYNNGKEFIDVRQK